MPHWESNADQDLFVSTGRLPARERVQDLVSSAYERYRGISDGQVSSVYPALARVPSELFGICVLQTDGSSFVAGDCDTEFAIMSVAKPFVFALVCELLGPRETRDRLGVNATGLPFNSLTSIEQAVAGRTNPMVNPGAIATTSLVPGVAVRSAGAFWLTACHGSRVTVCTWTTRCLRQRRSPTNATGAWRGCSRASAR